MRKIMSATILICMVAFLFTLSMPAVHATPRIAASGDWTYTPSITGVRLADGNTFRYGEEDSNWAGTFSGTSHDVFTVVLHDVDFANVRGLIVFDGSVNREDGTLVIRFVGKRTLPAGEWYGQWVILSGTDGLANLRGQGTWWGPPTNVDYSGMIHFD